MTETRTPVSDAAFTSVQELARDNMPELMVNSLAWAFYHVALRLHDEMTRLETRGAEAEDRVTDLENQVHYLTP